jgi:hypothetical protein
VTIHGHPIRLNELVLLLLGISISLKSLKLLRKLSRVDFLLGNVATPILREELVELVGVLFVG